MQCDFIIADNDYNNRKLLVKFMSEQVANNIKDF